MNLYYVDTSALVKRLRQEVESSSLEQFLKEREPVTLVSSELLVTELHRVALRQGQGAPELAESLLSRISLRRLPRTLLASAGTIIPVELRSLDAIHLATALELRDDLKGMLTYDDRLADAAKVHGLTVLAPGHNESHKNVPGGW